MKIAKTPKTFTLTGTVEELDFLQAIAYYAKLHTFTERDEPPISGYPRHDETLKARINKILDVELILDGQEPHHEKDAEKAK